VTFQVGIMQGRLSPPRPDSAQFFPDDRWRQEFPLAKECGFDAIEWLYDITSEDSNPLLQMDGVQEIVGLSHHNGVGVHTICSDYFKNRSLADTEESTKQERSDRLVQVVKAAAAIGATTVLVPFLEESAVPQPGDRELANKGLAPGLDAAADNGINIALETDLPAPVLRDWMTGIGHAALGIYYDLGNAVAMGFDPLQEIPMLRPWLRGVHIKDRTLNGPNVPLGTGSVDFKACFEALRKADYQGLLVLETIRGADYVTDAKRHISYVREQVASLI